MRNPLFLSAYFHGCSSEQWWFAMSSHALKTRSDVFCPHLNNHRMLMDQNGELKRETRSKWGYTPGKFSKSICNPSGEISWPSSNSSPTGSSFLFLQDFPLAIGQMEWKFVTMRLPELPKIQDANKKRQCEAPGHDSYPQVNKQKTIEIGPFIVDFPIEYCDFP